ncbi:MAG: hypothetical protein KAU41_03600, partial [Deltaproteobacteria bacterium]|nr:hypothetical protein [Deltaproteobacteria bacterium]
HPSPPSGWVWDLLIIARACYNHLTLKNVGRARHTTTASRATAKSRRALCLALAAIMEYREVESEIICIKF